MVSTAFNLAEWQEPQRRRLSKALLASVLIHLALLGLWQVGKHYDWWSAAALPDWLRPLLLRTPLAKPPLQNPAISQPKPEPQLVFVDVDPSLATPEAPPDAKYYSSQSTRAANPEAVTIETGQPLIDGTQTRVPKTFDTLRPAPPQAVVQPQPETPEPAKEELNPAQPGSQRTEGNTMIAKAQPQAAPRTDKRAGEGQESEKRERPRTLLAAKMQKGMIQGEKMRQTGGTQRRGTVALDVKGTPFGAYDAAIVAAIQKRWYDLLDERSTGVERAGKVIVEFRLNHTGTVNDVRVNETTVGDYLALLCQKAIEDPAPYPQWPSDMRRLNRSDFREVRFTFYYN